MRPAWLLVLLPITFACGDDSPDDGSSTGGAGGTTLVGPGGSGDPAGSGGADPSCFDYGSFDGANPTTSFAADVLPIFQQSCGLSTACHGDASGTSGLPYLGPPMTQQPTPEQITAIFAANVNVPSTHEPGMSRITPGDPARSFLMHKLDGSFDCPLLECGATMSCGQVEPNAAPPLDPARRNTIRSWIAQGANST